MKCRTWVLKERLLKYYDLGEWDFLYISSSTMWMYDDQAQRPMPKMEYTIHLNVGDIDVFQRFTSWYDLEFYADTKLMVPRTADELLGGYYGH